MLIQEWKLGLTNFKKRPNYNKILSAYLQGKNSNSTLKFYMFINSTHRDNRKNKKGERIVVAG